MSLFDLSGIVSQLATHTVTVTRFATDTFNAQGKANARTVADTFSASMSVQPGGKRLERGPEFNENDDLITVFCYVELQTRDRLAIPLLGDFEIERVEPWNSTGTFCEATARKLAAPFEPR